MVERLGVRHICGFIMCLMGPLFEYNLGDNCLYLYNLDNVNRTVDLRDYQILQNEHYGQWLNNCGEQ